MPFSPLLLDVLLLGQPSPHSYRYRNRTGAVQGVQVTMHRILRCLRVPSLSLALPLIFLVVSSPASSTIFSGETWTDSVTYRMPDESAAIRRVTRAGDWLKKHVVTFSHPETMSEVRVIAWKDPTLAPEDPKLLAGYVITDTLWAAKALKPLDKKISDEIELGIRRLGWSGNGLHDVLFHPVKRMLHRSADDDIVHGHSLGHFDIDGGRRVDLRVFRQKYDADYEVGHPHLFAEHAVYQALFDFWQGRKLEARRRIIGIVTDERGTAPDDQIFWDGKSGILVDYVNREDWNRFQARTVPTCRNFSFKLGVLVYAIRLMGLEREIGPAWDEINARLWSAQAADGGIAHYVDVQSGGKLLQGRRDSTGESTAIAILSETVRLPANSTTAIPQ